MKQDATGAWLELYAIMCLCGRRRLALVLALVLWQALLQTLAVFSLIPFLVAVSDVNSFRESRFGQIFVDLVGGGSDNRILIMAGLLSLAVLVIGNITTLWTELSRARYAHFIAHQLRVGLLKGLLDRRYEYFLHTNTSVLVKNLIDDVGHVADQLVMPVLDIIARGVLIALLVSVLLIVEPWIALGGGLVVALYYLTVMRRIRRAAHATSDKVKTHIRRLYFELFQALTGIKPILAADRGRFFVQRAERASSAFASEMPRIPMYSAIPRSGLEVLVFGGMILWVLVALATGGNLLAMLPRIGLVALVVYRLMPSVQTLFAQISAMSSARQALEEVSDLMRQQQALPIGSGSTRLLHAPLNWNREIRFEDVGFRYVGAEEDAIVDVSFTIAKGQRVALVGPTGSGKSTLVDLLLGLLHPTAGRILVDGTELTPDVLPAWRNGLGYVPQDLYLLDGTIAENIAFGADGEALDRDRVEQVADLAQAREFIGSDRSDGFTALVGERGVRLSGGQRQRLALARALYGRPNILVLDEATSALDPLTEQKVVTALAGEAEQLTVVTVTHRLNTVRDYDCIHYVENGRIVASGDFATLAETHGFFRELTD